MKINDPQVLAEVGAAFARYERALKEQDVATLDELFWASPLTLRYGIRENLYGHAEIAAYRSGGPGYDIARTDRRIVVTTYGTDFATTNLEFERGGRIGRQSQTWVRMPEGWRIVAAHVSYLQP